jgi:hypothetical protein
MRADAATIRSWIEWAYALFKPKVHNRIALVLVIAGVASAATPVWEPYLRAAAAKYLALDVDVPGSPWIGVAIILVAVLYHLGAQYTEAALVKVQSAASKSQLDRALKHDQEIADRFRHTFPEHSRDSLVRWLLDDHSCFTDQLNGLEESVVFLQSAEAHFLNQSVRELAARLIKPSTEMLGFVSYKFFPFPKDQRGDRLRIVLAPGLNVDREGDGTAEQSRKYNTLAEELEKLVRNWSDAYDALIVGFHQHLT